MNYRRPHLSPYFPMVWGFDLIVQSLDENQIALKGKVPVLEEDFQSGRDPYSCYLSSVKTQFGQKRAGKRSPHIAFANATTDEELVAFVREYGPVAPNNIKQAKPDEARAASLQFMADLREERCATENISCLRRERQTYAAALGLMTEVRRGEKNARSPAIREYISEIVLGVELWPDQWEYENRWRAANCPYPIAWQFDSTRCDRLWNLKFAADWEPAIDDQPYEAAVGKGPRTTPFDAGRMVLCELINCFPAGVDFFGNHAVESLPVNAVIFGIRPCLYLILRREWLSNGGATICRNDRCNEFFVTERAGQVFCSPLCSSQYRQRKYWAKVGSKKRKARRRTAGTLSRIHEKP